MHKSKFLFILLTFTSCTSNVKDIEPKYTSSYEKLTDAILSKINYTEISVEAVKKEYSDAPTMKELNLTLTNPQVKNYNQRKLDSLTSQIASIVKMNVSNISTYSWINIIYTMDDGSKVSDSIEKRVYVFRLKEIN